MQKLGNWALAGAIALAATACKDMNSGNKQGNDQAQNSVESAQKQSAKAFGDAKDAQEKAAKAQDDAQKAQQDVQKKQQDLADAQKKADEARQKAQAAQQQASQQGEQAQQQAKQYQQQAQQGQQAQHQQAQQQNQAAAPPPQQPSGQEQAQRSTVTGDLVRVDAHQIVLRTANDPEKTLTVDQNTKVWVNGQEAEVGQLQEGSQVRAAFEQQGDSTKALSISAKVVNDEAPPSAEPPEEPSP